MFKGISLKTTFIVSLTMEWLWHQIHCCFSPRPFIHSPLLQPLLVNFTLIFNTGSTFVFLKDKSVWNSWSRCYCSPEDDLDLSIPTQVVLWLWLRNPKEAEKPWRALLCSCARPQAPPAHADCKCNCLGYIQNEPNKFLFPLVIHQQLHSASNSLQFSNNSLVQFSLLKT